MITNPSQPSKAVYDAVLFDFDGTLYDSLGEIVDAVQETAQRLDYPIPDPESIRLAIGSGVRALILDLFGQNTPADKVEAILKEYRSMSDRPVPKDCGPFDGVRDLLDQLHAQKIPMGIVSNKSAGRLNSILRQGKLTEYFASVVGGDTLKFAKPSPEPVWHCLREMKINNWTRCLLVGDSIQDAEAAQKAGTDFVWVSWGKIRSQPPVEGCKSIDHPHELLSLLGFSA